MSLAQPIAPAPSVLRWTAISFVYWLVFMGALAPGNIENAIAAGATPDLAREAARLLGAGLLGASVTPLLLQLAARLPVSGEDRWRNLAVQALAVAMLAPALIAASCLLAGWVFAGELLPSLRDVAEAIRANLLLLVLCISLLLAAIQIAPRPPGSRPAASGPWPDRIAVGERGRVVMVELSSVDWIESQGNYQALHVGDAAYLLRETSASLSARLDPARFVRIHRRFIVAADRVRHVEPLANGDAIVRLANGVELRQSRAHRQAFRRRLNAAD
jgi:hypothetical protein